MLRGEVYWVDIDGVGTKPLLVVSNNGRNGSGITSVLTVRLTTSPNVPVHRGDVIPLVDGDRPLVGHVLCGEVNLTPKSRLGNRAGALTAGTMQRVSDGLRVALNL